MAQTEVTEHKSPGMVLTLMLFLFLYIHIRVFIPGVPALWSQLMDTIVIGQGIVNGIGNFLFWLCFFILIFWSVIKMLRFDSDAVTTFRWAIGCDFIFLFFLALLNLMQTGLFGWSRQLILLGFFLYDILQLIYLRRSKAIQDLYPQTLRRKSPGCWVWSTFLALTVVVPTIGTVPLIKKSYKSRPIDPYQLHLPTGAISDGRVWFMADTLWMKADSCTLFQMDDTPYDCVLYHRTDKDNGKTLLISGKDEGGAFADYVYLYTQLRPFADSSLVREILWGDTVIQGDRYWRSQYLYQVQGNPCVWTCLARYDQESFRFAAVSDVSYRNHPDSLYQAARAFMEQLHFCSKEDTLNQDIQEDNSRDVCNRIHDKMENVESTVTESLLPRKTLGIMRSQDEKSGKSDREKRIFFQKPNHTSKIL